MAGADRLQQLLRMDIERGRIDLPRRSCLRKTHLILDFTAMIRQLPVDVVSLIKISKHFDEVGLALGKKLRGEAK